MAARWTQTTGLLTGGPSAGSAWSAGTTESRFSPLAGNVKQNLAPHGGLSAAHKRPPCDSTIPVEPAAVRDPETVPKLFSFGGGDLHLILFQPDLDGAGSFIGELRSPHAIPARRSRFETRDP